MQLSYLYNNIINYNVVIIEYVSVHIYMWLVLLYFNICSLLFLDRKPGKLLFKTYKEQCSVFSVHITQVHRTEFNGCKWLYILLRALINDHAACKLMHYQFLLIFYALFHPTLIGYDIWCLISVSELFVGLLLVS